MSLEPNDLKLIADVLNKIELMEERLNNHLELLSQITDSLEDLNESVGNLQRRVE